MRRSNPARRRGPGLAALALAALATAGGCVAPTVSFVAQTTIARDGRTTREVTIACQPRKRTPPQALRLTAYLDLPEPDRYAKYKNAPTRVTFEGAFPSPDEVPVDFVKRTRRTDLLAYNRLLVRRRGYVLFEALDFEESIDDIVDRSQAEASVDRAANLLAKCITGALEAEFGEDYDLTQLNAYLRETLPALADRLYQVFWEVRRSQRDLVAGEAPTAEWDRRLKQELSDWGLHLLPGQTRVTREVNEKALWSFLDAKLKALVPEPEGDLEPLRAESFRDKEVQTRLLFRLIEQAKQERNTAEAFLRDLDLPGIVGAFGGASLPLRFDGNDLEFALPDPSFYFLFRVRLPGQVIQTNAARDLDGSLVWRFSGRDLVLTGHRMWARTLVVDREAVRRIGLKGFPGSLAAVEQYHDAITGPNGAVDPKLMALVRRCVDQGSLRPLQAAAVPSEPVPTPEMAPDPNGDGAAVRPDAARELLSVLSVFYEPGPRADTDAPAPRLAPPAPERGPEERDAEPAEPAAGPLEGLPEARERVDLEDLDLEEDRRDEGPAASGEEASAPELTPEAGSEDGESRPDTR